MIRLKADPVLQEEKAFEAFYATISGKMYSLCVRYTGSNYHANQAFQQGLLLLYRGFGRYKNTPSCENWARQIFVQACINYVTENEVILFPGFSRLNLTADNLINADAVIRPEELHSFIQQLPVSYRLITNLCLVEAYEHEEAWKILGISAFTGNRLLSQIEMLFRNKESFSQKK